MAESKQLINKVVKELELLPLSTIAKTAIADYVKAKANCSNWVWYWRSRSTKELVRVYLLSRYCGVENSYL